MRYSKGFRIVTGILGFVAGLANFGIIPAVGARFLVYFLGIPPVATVLGFSIESYIPLMAVLLSITVTITLSGGVITLLVTNCVEGIISQFCNVALIIGLICMFSWKQMLFALTHLMTSSGVQARGPGESLINPFDTEKIHDFNIWYVLMGLVWGIYGTMAWQNQSAYNSAAFSAHESRMGNVVGGWRSMTKGPVTALLALGAMVYLMDPDFAKQAADVKALVAKIPETQIQEQMIIPVAISHMLPVGLKGALCVILLLGVFGGDGNHLHSWGSMFIQDVIVPLRKTPLSPREHIRLLRYSITGVATFAFLFGMLFRQTEYIVMWWGVTMSLYIGGVGAAIIGGLYWKKGTTEAAWATLAIGFGLTAAGIIARQIYGNAFPLNGTMISFYTMIVAGFTYVVVSLCTCRTDYNLESMLHRGKYAKHDEVKAKLEKDQRLTWSKIIGFDENFSRSDLWIAGSFFLWGMFWFFVFLVGTIWNAIRPWSDDTWGAYWQFTCIDIPIIWALIGTVWFTWGGLRDMKILFEKLHVEKRNAFDNGMVVGAAKPGRRAEAEGRARDQRRIDRKLMSHQNPFSKLHASARATEVDLALDISCSFEKLSDDSFILSGKIKKW